MKAKLLAVLGLLADEMKKWANSQFTPKTRKINNKTLSADINLSASDVGAIPTTQKGAANGVAELDSSGKVPAAQLPSYVDDVIEGYLSGGKLYKEQAHTTEIIGEAGKIYVDLATDKTYRWSGSAYVVISETIALGETSATAFRGDRGKAAYDHSQAAHAPANAEQNVQSDWSITDTSSDAYIKNKPTSMPANGGNAATVGGFTLGKSVPADAVFTDTKPVNMKGATASAAGTAGYVPAPTAGSQASKYLRADGTWQTPPNTTYGDFKGATASAAGGTGLVPAPAAGKQGQFLRGDGTWAAPADTKYNKATASADGLMSKEHYQKLEAMTPDDYLTDADFEEITQAEIAALFS